jgi:transglutaminase-like putative cysteine protease
MKTALGAYEERRGVCRDFAHLGIAFCRDLNIPARYCTGYLGDIGVPPVDAPMDFGGWFEAYRGG